VVIYALDASAILRFLDGEAGGDRVRDLLKEQVNGNCSVVVSAVHWGEVASVTAKLHGTDAVVPVLSQLTSFGMEVVPATAERAVRAGLIKVARKIPYADAFGVELAAGTPDCMLVTADFEVKPAEQEIKIEFLPKK
jgi:predicted nucleic acid-binding protein